MTQRTIIIADDHTLVRSGIRLMVQEAFPWAQFLEAEDADSLGRHMAMPCATLALVDLNMPGMAQGERLRELVLGAPWLPVVAVSGMTATDVIQKVLAIPTVYAFVPKNAQPQHMRVAIDAALARRKMPYEALLNDEPAGPLLSPRLEQVRSLVRQGFTNKEIAHQLVITEGTVKNYLTEIFRQLGVSNQTQAAGFDAQ